MSTVNGDHNNTERHNKLRGWARDTRLVSPCYAFYEIATHLPSGATVIPLDVLGRWSDEGLARLQESAHALLPLRHRWVITANIGRATLVVYCGRVANPMKDDPDTERLVLKILYRTFAVALAGSSYERGDDARLHVRTRAAIELPTEGFVSQALDLAAESLQEHPLLVSGGAYPDRGASGWFTWKRCGVSDRARHRFESEFKSYSNGECYSLSKAELLETFEHALSFPGGPPAY